MGKFKGNSGFSLVEMMVAVAIVGILAAVAIPGYMKYVRKGYQVEGKLSLAQVYTRMQSYRAENGTYTACVAATGVRPETERYYMVGIKSATDLCGRNGDKSCAGVAGWQRAALTTCNTATDLFFPATKKGSGGSSPTIPTLASQMSNFPAAEMVSRDRFRAEALGNLGGNGGASIFDRWSIDQKKDLHYIWPAI